MYLSPGKFFRNQILLDYFFLIIFIFSSEPIEKIFGTIDYVIDLNNLAKFGFGKIFDFDFGPSTVNTGQKYFCYLNAYIINSYSILDFKVLWVSPWRLTFENHLQKRFALKMAKFDPLPETPEWTELKKYLARLITSST